VISGFKVCFQIFNLYRYNAAGDAEEDEDEAASTRGARAARVPEVSPGSVDPEQVPGSFAPPTFWPAFTVGGYHSKGPLAERLTTWGCVQVKSS
jgi:hypothetical protein